MAIQELPLIIQTSYAELIDQLRLSGTSAFPEGSTFRKRTISGKDYWYVQAPTNPTGRPPERYLGPDTLDRRAAIDNAKTHKANSDVRKSIRRSLVGAGLPEPDSLTSAVIDAFAEAGVFRLRGVIVGTVAFQAYSGLLGIKLPGTAVRTGDLDLAQDYGVSVAINDALDSTLIEILKTVDPAFAPVPSLSGPNIAVTYARPGGYRVDVLTTNRGADRDAPVRLPSLKSDAVPLRFLQLQIPRAYAGQCDEAHGFEFVGADRDPGRVEGGAHAARDCGSPGALGQRAEHRVEAQWRAGWLLCPGGASRRS